MAKKKSATSSRRKPQSKNTPKTAAKSPSKKASTAKKTSAGIHSKASGTATPKSVAARARSPKPSDELSVAITFREGPGKPGLVTLGGPASAEQLRSFEPSELDIRRAVAVLEKHGFELSSRGAYSIVVRGRKSQYEKLFGTKLSQIPLSSELACFASAPAVYFPSDGAPWKPDPEISHLIDEAYIQWPHIYMSSRFPYPPSALPPRVNYHHLRVPGDVVMLLNAAKVHREGITGLGVRVAMIDSGFTLSHPYFQENGYRTSVVLAPGASHPATDSNGHGTGESANLLAVAPDINFVGIKLDSETGAGASLLAGFQEALRQRPQIITVSLGYDLAQAGPQRAHLTQLPNSLRALEAEIQAAVASGIVVIFSAGNGHVAFPGMMPDVISAGGVYVAEDGQMQASDYASGFKSRIYPGRIVPDFSGLVGLAENDASYIALPVQVGSELDGLPDGTQSTDGWAIFSGTSAAAPQIAGICALLLQKSPSLSPSEIKQIIRRTSRDVTIGQNNKTSSENTPNTAAIGPDTATGTGLVDAFAAYRQL